jgi:hypothetical protein
MTGEISDAWEDLSGRSSSHDALGLELENININHLVKPLSHHGGHSACVYSLIGHSVLSKATLILMEDEK